MLLETERLILREFTLADAPFIITLLNTPAWIEFIGDRNVHSVKDAENYLTNGPMKSYSENGYGLCCVLIKDTPEPIGMSGVIKRNGLENPDIGFAFLPEHNGKGFGYEIAKAILRYADEVLKFPAVDAITNDHNQSSIGLLKKLGFSFSKEITLPGSDEVLLLFRINFTDH